MDLWIMNTMNRFTRVAASMLVIAPFALLSCSKSETPPPSPDPPTNAASAAPSASAASVPREAVKSIPTLVLEEFAPAGQSKPEAVFGVDGAVLVTHGQRVGRIVGDGIEWLKEAIPPTVGGPYGTQIDSVEGRFPDAIDVLFSSDSVRMPMPSYMPLTGKGRPISLALGGQPAGYLHLAHVGESVLLYGWVYGTGIEFSTVRGPKLLQKQQSPAEAGCKPGEVELGDFFPYKPAIFPRALAASRSGVLATAGPLCEMRGPTLEVWENSEKSKLVDLTPHIKDMGWWPRLLGGKDEIWLYSGKRNPIVQYKGGEVSALPRLEVPISHAFVSASGELHALAGASLSRFGNGKWTEIGRLSWPMIFRTMVIDGDSMWASAGGVVYRIREGKGWSFADDCKTPFVYLYDVNPGNANGFTFPGTRKALATFPSVAEIELVEINEGSRYLGVVVKNKEQGEALIAHVKANMKEESPLLICYEAKKKRVIKINGGK